MSADDKVYTISNIKFAKGGNIDSAVVTADFTKKGYRLPTEAEWEYAARGGDPLKADWNYLFSGAASAENVSYDSTMNAGLDAVGWYSKNLINGKTDETIDLKPDSEGNKIIPVGYGTHEAGKKAPNAPNNMGFRLVRNAE